jgi:hypothetical protein
MLSGATSGATLPLSVTRITASGIAKTTTMDNYANIQFVVSAKSA